MDQHSLIRSWLTKSDQRRSPTTSMMEFPVCPDPANDVTDDVEDDDTDNVDGVCHRRFMKKVHKEYRNWCLMREDNIRFWDCFGMLRSDPTLSGESAIYTVSQTPTSEYFPRDLKNNYTYYFRDHTQLDVELLRLHVENPRLHAVLWVLTDNPKLQVDSVLAAIFRLSDEQFYEKFTFDYEPGCFSGKNPLLIGPSSRGHPRETNDARMLRSKRCRSSTPIRYNRLVRCSSGQSERLARRHNASSLGRQNLSHNWKHTTVTAEEPTKKQPLRWLMPTPLLARSRSQTHNRDVTRFSDSLDKDDDTDDESTDDDDHDFTPPKSPCHFRHPSFSNTDNSASSSSNNLNDNNNSVYCSKGSGLRDKTPTNNVNTTTIENNDKEKAKNNSNNDNNNIDINKIRYVNSRSKATTFSGDNQFYCRALSLPDIKCIEGIDNNANRNVDQNRGHWSRRVRKTVLPRLSTRIYPAQGYSAYKLKKSKYKKTFPDPYSSETEFQSVGFKQMIDVDQNNIIEIPSLKPDIDATTSGNNDTVTFSEYRKKSVHPSTPYQFQSNWTTKEFIGQQDALLKKNYITPTIGQSKYDICFDLAKQAKKFTVCGIKNKKKAISSVKPYKTPKENSEAVTLAQVKDNIESITMTNGEHKSEVKIDSAQSSLEDDYTPEFIVLVFDNTMLREIQNKAEIRVGELKECRPRGMCEVYRQAIKELGATRVREPLLAFINRSVHCSDKQSS